MNLRTAIISATTAAVLASGGVAIAGASSTSTPKPTTATTVASAKAKATPAARAAVRHKLRRAIRRGAGKVVTETIGIDRKTLRTDLLAGKTIADIANAHGVAPQTVIDALVAAATKKLDALAHAGRITTTRAQRIEQRLPARVTKIVNTWHPKRARATTP